MKNLREVMKKELELRYEKGEILDLLKETIDSLPKDLGLGLPSQLLKDLFRLMEGYPLTPLEDREEDWEPMEFDSKIAYHKRMPRLIKTESGVCFMFNRIKFIDVVNPMRMVPDNVQSVIMDLVDKKYPIKFPYQPYNQIVVYAMWTDDMSPWRIVAIKDEKGYLEHINLDLKLEEESNEESMH